jgi:transcriptional regulator GlxA family with amidase domain
VTIARRVGVFAFEGVQLLDVAGPLDAFSVASRLIERRGGTPYRVGVVAERRGPVRCAGGVSIVADWSLSSLRAGTLDTLLVAGGESWPSALTAPTRRGLRRASEHVPRMGSICLGAFILAELGFFDGRRAVTHWRWCAKFAAAYPAIKVDGDAIFVRDGDRWSSAGVTAGIDLALAMVEADHGRAVALETARALVVFLRRPGGQSQFSAALAADPGDEPALRLVQQEIVADPAGDHRVERLAERAGLSVRHFARAFRKASGATPAAFVERVRVEAACRRLEATNEDATAIARACGFASADVMRRAFARRTHVSPQAYRRRFS